MNKKAKIVVLHMKELIYTGLFLILGVLLVVIIILMFSGKNSELVSDSKYTPGQYTTSLTLNGTVMDVKVTVDENSITAIGLEHLEDSVSVMFPLMEPTLEDLSSQIIETQSLDNISYAEDRQYTSLLLLDAIASSLEQAENPQNSTSLE
ncbi:MAG: hypothetical protein IKW30_06160 [Lachnospiraceae bacterium]|nr:hypothetical protein [Lachnospiraceae bacterium]